MHHISGRFSRRARAIPKKPQVLSLTPHTLADVWENIRQVGRATQRDRDAQSLAIALEQKVTAIEMKAARAAKRPRVLCLEWLDPYYVGGHWVPEMVAKAGGEDALGVAGKPSSRVTSEQIAESRADIILVMPCGYSMDRTNAECRMENYRREWNDLPAIREQQVYIVDSNAYFSRPGPRLADGVALLAELLHPEIFSGMAPPNSFCRI